MWNPLWQQERFELPGRPFPDCADADHLQRVYLPPWELRHLDAGPPPQRQETYDCMPKKTHHPGWSQFRRISSPLQKYRQSVTSAAKSHIGSPEKSGPADFDPHEKKDSHGLGSQERLLLQIAVILHGCGKYISLSDPADCFYQIIMATEIIGLSRKEAGRSSPTLSNSIPQISVLRGAEPGRPISTVPNILRWPAGGNPSVANACDRSLSKKFEMSRSA